MKKVQRKVKRLVGRKVGQSSAASTVDRRPPISSAAVQEVALPPATILRVKVPPATIPLIVAHPDKGYVEIAPVKKKRAWWQTILDW